VTTALAHNAVIHDRSRNSWTLLFAALLLALLANQIRAGFQSLAERLPAASNALVAVNVEKVLNSPFAQQEQWRQNIADSWAKQPLMIPPGATRLLMAASVKTSSMESYWEMSLIEMEKVPSAQELAKADGGHVDKIWDKLAAYSPINAYFIPMDATVLASITPAERSEIARWVRQPPKQGGNVTSPYIKEVAASLTDNTDIVMAIDLEGAWGVPTVSRFLANSEIKEIPVKEADQLASLLGTLKGLTLDIRVDRDVIGRATIQLDRDAAPLRASAKPLTLAVLNAAGMRLDDVRDWNFTVAGKQIKAEGKLSRNGLRQLLSLVQSPIPAATAAAPKAPGDAQVAGGAQAASDPAVASQRYFKAICASLDSLTPGASAASTATWIRNTARRIDQLPILNVDPALVEWGALVSGKLKQAGATMGLTQTQINSRVAGVADPDFGNYDYNGGYDGWYNDAQVENARRQRRQVALEQRAQGQEQALGILSSIADSRTKIRLEMVTKYKVEF
jgi:hypothetical protein